jgi:hypothetical protein
MLSQIIDLVLPPGMVVLTAWFYPHCARPNLAFASAPRNAFTLCLISTCAILTGWAIIAADQVAILIGGPVIPGWWYRPTIIVLFVTWLIPTAAFLRPGWFGRLGSEDPTAGPRFLLTWFRRQWPRLEDAQRVPFARMLERELEKIREPANADFIDAWVQTLGAFVHAAGLGRTSSGRGRAALEDRLGAIVPVDPVARWV